MSENIETIKAIIDAARFAFMNMDTRAVDLGNIALLRSVAFVIENKHLSDEVYDYFKEGLPIGLVNQFLELYSECR